MNSLCFILCFISVFVLKIHTAPLVPAINVYDVVTTNFSKTCPFLSNNTLIDSSTKYLSVCKDITVNNIPDKISLFNTNPFYCIGILAADFHYCNVLSNSSYKYLPKSIVELDAHIASIQKVPPGQLCGMLNYFNLFNVTNINPFLTKPLSELKKGLRGPQCPKLCSDLIENVSNEVCAMIYFIYSQINNVSKSIELQNSVVRKTYNLPLPIKLMETTTKNIAHTEKKTPAAKQEKPAKIVETTTNLETAPKKEITVAGQSNLNLGGTNLVKNPKPTEAPDIQTTVLQPVVIEAVVKDPSATADKGAPSVGDKDAPSVGDKVASSVDDNVAPSVGEKGATSADRPIIETPKEASQDQGENEAKTKVVDVTNENPKDTKAKLDKIEHTADEKETTTPNSEINYMKQNPENIDDYNDENEDDDDDSLKINDEANSVVQKVPEQYTNSRVDTIPSMKEAVEEEESNFFSYFMFISVMFIAGYVIYHNKQKIMALVVEGRRDRNSRRRPSTSSYRKLNSNLEEAVTSKCSGSASHVIY